MKHWERLCELHKILLARRYPISRKSLQEHLDCSRATVSRTINDLRDYFRAPIDYDPEHGGYLYRQEGEKPIEVPGLWFTPAELRALLVLQKLLSQTNPRLFDTLLAPLRTRLDDLISHPRIGGDQLARRVRILNQGHREPDSGIFERVSAALLQRKRLDAEYLGRQTQRLTTRLLSPQRLVFYRDNWYLDAWCHTRQELRRFSLDRLQSVQISEQPAEDIPEDRLETHFAASYGIFAGPPQHTAILRYTPERARWVAEETWFPDQQGEFLADGRNQLTLPYSDPRELIMDILKYGPDVEVVEPAELREQVVARLRETLARYTSAAD